jgi:hypothetical protein
LLAGLLVGFAKTFFLRSQFNVPPMPSYLYVHGLVLTTWFVLVLAQTCLVAAHRTDLHRRLGLAAVADAVLIIPISAFVVVRAAQRTHGAITAGCAQTSHDRRFTIYGPVFVRFDSVYGLPIPPPVVVPLALVALGTYDLMVVRRLHRATVWICQRDRPLTTRSPGIREPC